MLLMGEEAFRIVYDAVVNGVVRQKSEGILRECVDVASKNKVLLQFLRASGTHNDLRFREELRYRRFLKALKLVSDALDGLPYSFIKLRKPVRYVPSDIDVLIDIDSIRDAYLRLKALGFHAEVLEPYTLTVTKGGIIVDLYVHPTVAGVIYADGNELLRHKELIDFEGIRIPALRTYAEALITAAHAVYKEGIYTLNDYVTVRRWLSKETIELAEGMSCTEAIREAIAINKSIGKQGKTLSHKIPLGRWLAILNHKALKGLETRATILNLAKAVRDRRFGEQIKSKLTWETY